MEQADIGLLIEPNIFERPKVVTGKDPVVENKFYSSSIDITDDIISMTVLLIKVLRLQIMMHHR